MKGYNKIRKKSLEILCTKLPNNLYYHGVHHTLNVLKVSNAYISREGIGSHEAKLLRLGVLLHDIGYAVSNFDHEAMSAQIAETLMSEFGFKKKDISIVKDLIMATKVPQHPKNMLEKIICDADLDYLGRDDFYNVSDLLYKELKADSKVTDLNSWNILQIQFLKKHKFHTAFARKYRQPKKEERIAELKMVIELD